MLQTMKQNQMTAKMQISNYWFYSKSLVGRKTAG